MRTDKLSKKLRDLNIRIQTACADRERAEFMMQVNTAASEQATANRQAATSKHTAGPWTCHSGEVYVDGPTVFPKGNDNGIRIALMDREPTTPTTPCERDANARLIAAAPELLAALRSFVEAEQDAHWEEQAHDVKGCRYCEAVAAIAKAEGRDDQ